MFYSDPHSAALSYGKVNEHNAIEAYIDYKKAQGIGVSVQSVGMILSKDRPGFGANLDGIVSDSSVDKKGGLEVKCPISKSNMTADETCSDNTLYLIKDKNGNINLKSLSPIHFVKIRLSYFIGNEFLVKMYKL